MKITYKVTLMVTDRNALVDIIDAVEGKAATIDIATVQNEVAPKPKIAVAVAPPRVRKERRAKRKSKVNEAILKAMSYHPATVAALKEALEAAGMSASSLSTGIAILTKAGQIERVGEGLYGLKVQKAAE